MRKHEIVFNYTTITWYKRGRDHALLWRGCIKALCKRAWSCEIVEKFTALHRCLIILYSCSSKVNPFLLNSRIVFCVYLKRPPALILCNSCIKSVMEEKHDLSFKLICYFPEHSCKMRNLWAGFTFTDRLSRVMKATRTRFSFLTSFGKSLISPVFFVISDKCTLSCIVESSHRFFFKSRSFRETNAGDTFLDKMNVIFSTISLCLIW